VQEKSYGVTKSKRIFRQPQPQTLLGKLTMFPRSLRWWEAGMLSADLPKDQRVKVLAGKAINRG